MRMEVVKKQFTFAQSMPRYQVDNLITSQMDEMRCDGWLFAGSWVKEHENPDYQTTVVLMERPMRGGLDDVE